MAHGARAAVRIPIEGESERERDTRPTDDDVVRATDKAVFRCECVCVCALTDFVRIHTHTHMTSAACESDTARDHRTPAHANGGRSRRPFRAHAAARYQQNVVTACLHFLATAEQSADHPFGVCVCVLKVWVRV